MYFAICGKAHKELKKYDEAITNYNEAIEIDLNNDEYFVERSDAYFSINKFDEAIRDFKQCHST